MDVEALLQDAWFQAARITRVPDLHLHPEDEMARLDLQKTDPARRRMFYMRTGYEAFLVLENLLAAAGRRLETSASLLDFACGYGRPLRFLAQRVPPERIWASDILPSAVDFVRSNFGVHGVLSASAPESIVFGRRFSVICVFSLFSHLPRRLFGPFLRLLHDALEPDGILLFSTHSPEILPAAERDASGFTYQAYSGIPYLDVEEYGATFADPAVVRAICRENGIEHVWCVERELWRIQDVYAVSKQRVPGLDGWKHTALARGAILRADVDARGQAWAGGYVRVPAPEAALESVHIVVDGTRRIPATFAAHPLPLPQEEGGARFRQTDWLVEGPAADLREGVHAVAAVARLRSGAEHCFDACVLARK